MDSSVLFRHLSKSPERDKVIERLYENYKNKFDFNLVNSSLFESAYENIHLKKTIKFLKIFCILLLMTTIFFIFKIIKQKSIIVEYEKINMKLNEFQQSNIKKIMEDEKIKLKLEEEIKNKNKSAEELKENLLNKSKEIEIIKNQKEHETKEKEKILKIIFQPSEYFIVSQNGLKFCIDSNGEYTFVSEFHGGPSQKWRLKGNAISNVRSGLVLDIRGSESVGRDIISFPSHGGLNQQWKLHDDGTIRSPHNICIEIRGRNLVSTHCSNNSNQKWKLINNFDEISKLIGE